MVKDPMRPTQHELGLQAHKATFNGKPGDAVAEQARRLVQSSDMTEIIAHVMARAHMTSLRIELPVNMPLPDHVKMEVESVTIDGKTSVIYSLVRA